MDRLTGMLNQNAGGAQGAYDQGLSMLRQLAETSMGTGGESPSAPNTSPQAAPVTGFPTELPTTYNPGLGNLIKQAFGSFVGDLGGQAITNARSRGFAGGADLLNTAAAPMMGQSLAQVPAMEAKAYLDHVLQAYSEQSQNAGRENAAGAQALNAATNALGPGVAKYGADVTKYGIDRQQDNNRIQAMQSLLQSLMGPQNSLMNANLGLLANAPRGTQQNSISGSQGNQTLSGSNTSNTQTGSQSQSQANTQGQNSTPIGNVIGTGIGNIIGGGAQGFANNDPNNFNNQLNKTLLGLLGGKK
jgi:hypothetical protein